MGRDLVYSGMRSGMVRGTGVCAVALALGVGLCAWGQGADQKPGTGSSAPTLSVNARLVQMAVTVREKKRQAAAEPDEKQL